ncbi:hypothetical protein EDB87DRAFT_1690028 [Lactarius vividus]|nr:hypothetical protein EDB87DRAFT_1690028 [Lactarius vividus]
MDEAAHACSSFSCPLSVILSYRLIQGTSPRPVIYKIEEHKLSPGASHPPPVATSLQKQKSPSPIEKPARIDERRPFDALANRKGNTRARFSSPARPQTSHAGSSCVELQPYEERLEAELLPLHQDNLSRLIDPSPDMLWPRSSRPRAEHLPRTVTKLDFFEEVRSMMVTNSDLQVRLDKARHGTASCEPKKDIVLLGRGASERDRLRAKVDAI